MPYGPFTPLKLDGLSLGPPNESTDVAQGDLAGRQGGAVDGHEVFSFPEAVRASRRSASRMSTLTASFRETPMSAARRASRSWFSSESRRLVVTYF